MSLIKALSGGAATITVVGALIAYPVMYKGSARETTIVVNEKERISTGSGENRSDKYIVFTDKGEYEVTDTILFFDWGASRRYGKLIALSECDVKVAGWRVEFLSMYPNIYEVIKCRGK